MNPRSLLFLCALAGLTGIGVRADAPPAEATTEAAPQPPAPLSPAQLDELLAPIALYPDPLIAIILPASTFPADLVLATRYLQSGGAADAIESQPWDDSVKALARYPEVLKWMDTNLAWTKQVGAAFAQQPADVLTCTQRLRTAARAAGTLKDTPEQKVVLERETIRIVPANPEIIYVPVYEPSWVYGYRSVNFYHPAPVIRFSTGYRTGHWLAYHCDWRHWNVIVINRPYRVAYWREYPRWHCPPPAVAHVRHVWRADPARTRVVVHQTTPRSTSSSTLRREVVRSQTPDSGAGRPAPSVARPTAPISTSLASPPPAGPRRGQIEQSIATARSPVRPQTAPEPVRPRNRLNASTTTSSLAPAPVAPPAPRQVPLASSPRIQFPTTGSDSNNLSVRRPRPAPALASPSPSAPVRPGSGALAAPRRQPETRSLSAPAPSRPANITPPSSTRPRTQYRDSAATSPAPSSAVEGETGFRRRQ